MSRYLANFSGARAPRRAVGHSLYFIPLQYRGLAYVALGGLAVAGADCLPTAGRLSVSRSVNVGPLTRAPVPCDSAFDLLLRAAVRHTAVDHTEARNASRNVAGPNYSGSRTTPIGLPISR